MANPSKAEVADEIERLLKLYGPGDGAWSEFVERNLPTILAALRSEDATLAAIDEQIQIAERAIAQQESYGFRDPEWLSAVHMTLAVLRDLKCRRITALTPPPAPKAGNVVQLRPLNPEAATDAQ